MTISKEFASIIGLALTLASAPVLHAADLATSSDRVGVQSTVPNIHANAILTELHRVNAKEIEMGKLATSKSPTPSVQAYAQKLVGDHSAAQKRVVDLASDRNVSLGLANESPTGESASTHKNTSMNKLDSLKGAAFDRAFLKQVVVDHTASVKMLRDAESKLGDAPEVKSLVTELIPVIQEHLSTANDLLKKVSKTGQSS